MTGRDQVADGPLRRTTFNADAYALADDVRIALADRYTIERALGRGATAVVYLAHDHVRGEPVALKILHDQLTAAVSAARFLREVTIAQQLQHEHIVQVFDSGSANGRAYYTMRYVEGQTLRDKLQQQGQLAISDVVSIAGQIASALDYAHSRGVVHRDIKPANILVTERGVMVADFGIARAMFLASGESLTDSGYLVGTPEYMSPEQSAGDRHVDGRSDLYGLACVVYEMVAGEPPFTGPTVQAILARHIQEAPRSLRVVRPTVSPAFERAVTRALAKVPVDRFETAEELVRELKAAAAEMASGSYGAQLDRAPFSALARRSRLRRMAIAGLSGTLLLSVLAGVLLWGAGTLSPSAWLAYQRGGRALNAGSFALADSQFTAAAGADGEYRPALIWSALLHWWMRPNQMPSALLVDKLTHPATRRAALGPVDTTLLAGLAALADRRFDVACRIWSDTSAFARRNAAVQYSLGTCLRNDDVVVRDGSSRSGWKFRSSYDRAVRAYEQAFELQPSLLQGPGLRYLDELQELFRTSSARTREGKAVAPDTGQFRAYPELDRDTLAYVPYPRNTALGGAAPRSIADAVDNQRRRLHAVTRFFRAAAPTSAIAAEALAMALEMRADTTALDTLRVARGLANNSPDVLRIAASEVLLRIKYALPENLPALSLRSPRRIHYSQPIRQASEPSPVSSAVWL